MSKNNNERSSAHVDSCELLEMLFPTHFGHSDSEIYTISSKGIENSFMFLDFKNNGFALTSIFSALLQRKVKYKKLNHAALEVFIGLLPEDGDFVCGIEEDHETAMIDIDTAKGIKLFARKGTNAELAECRRAIGFSPEIVKR